MCTGKVLWDGQGSVAAAPCLCCAAASHQGPLLPTTTQLFPGQHLLQSLRAMGEKRDKGLGQIAPRVLLRSLQSLQVPPGC